MAVHRVKKYRQPWDLMSVTTLILGVLLIANGIIWGLVGLR
jgi:hypothetical protein